MVKIKKAQLSSNKDLGSLLNEDYFQTLEDLKQKIRQAQLRASLSVNLELIKLY